MIEQAVREGQKKGKTEEKKDQSWVVGVRIASKKENSHIRGFSNKTVTESHECKWRL